MGTALVAALATRAITDGVVSDLTYVLVTVGAAIAACVGVARHPERRRTPWLGIAGGVVLSAIADVIWQVIVWTRDAEPDVSVADAFWIGSYVALFAGLVLLLRERSAEHRIDAEALIDMAAVAAVMLVLAWQFMIADTIADASAPVSVRLIWAAYPVLDAMLLTLVLRVIVSHSGRALAGVLLAAGVACWLFSDIMFALIDASEGMTIALDAGWMLGAALLAAAIWHRPAIEPAREPGAESIGRGRAALTLAPLLVASALEIWGDVRNDDVNPWPLLALTVTLIVLAYVRTTRTLDAAKRARARLQSRENHFRALAANSSDAVLVMDRDGIILNEGIGLSLLVGYSDHSIQGSDAFAAINADDLDDTRAIFDRVLQSPATTFESELRTTHADGSELWLAARAVNLIDDPDVAGVVVTLHDITDRKRVEDELEHRAFHDVLTGLANRALFRNRLEHALDRTRRSDVAPAVVFMDLDGFKTVNDSLGHDAGDEVLREVARRLESATRSGDTVARFGGDEFAILIEGSRHPAEEAEGFAERVLSTCADPVTVLDQQIRLSASLGVAVGDHESTATSLLRNADVAMYRAKSAGKGRWIVFDPAMRVAALERLRFESDLIGALDTEQFRLVYQPVVELKSDAVVGFEALLRWDHPTLGMLAPERFIQIIEENGLIVPIGAWVLQEACRTGARWQSEYGRERPLSMAVNISGRQLASRDLVTEVAYALEESGFDPSLLVLEITETVLVADAALASRRLRELRELGIRVAIDDFGTGYSSLSYLREFPVDILKIDKTFVDAITDVKKMPAIVRGLLDLGHTLDLEIIAEGVELTVQRDQLRAEQCTFAQGFLFAEPLDASEVELLLMRATGADSHAESHRNTRG